MCPIKYGDANSNLTKKQSYLHLTIKCVFKYWPVAQLVERLTVNQDVAGSSPAGSANNNGRNAVYPWETGVIYCGVEQR